MNLSKLFEVQHELDERIIKKHGLQDMDRLPYLILALQVELGELANEWRGFKFWSTDREPRTKIEYFCPNCDGTGDENHVSLIEDLQGGYTHDYVDCEDCGGTGSLGIKNSLLEEYVDCLHFILSIGLHCKFEKKIYYPTYKIDTISQFNRLFDKIGVFNGYQTFGNYDSIFSLFLGLGEKLGFTWEQIEQAYLDKNKVNHDRQESGY